MTRCPHCGQSHGPDNHFCSVTGQPLDLGPRLIGQVLLGRYEVRMLLGEGPVGAVLKAADKQAGDALVAIKMIHPQFARDAAVIDRFLSEAEKAGKTGHPNLAIVHAVGRDPAGAPVVVREFLDGMSLARYARTKGTLDESTACWIVGQMLAGLQAVHEVGLFNGDLTANDVFLASTPDGGVAVKLLDFGEAPLKQALEAAGIKDEGKLYAAPEQVRSGIINELSDVFAAGTVLYRLATGRLPYPDGIPPAPQVIPVPPSPSSIQPRLNRKLDILVRRAMSLLPTDRYRSAKLFADALAPFLPASPPAIDLAAAAGRPSEPSIPSPAPRTTPRPGAVSVGTAPHLPVMAPAAATATAAAPFQRKATLVGAPGAAPGGPAAGAPQAPEPVVAPARPTTARMSAPAAPAFIPPPVAAVAAPAAVAPAVAAPAAVAPAVEGPPVTAVAAPDAGAERPAESGPREVAAPAVETPVVPEVTIDIGAAAAPAVETPVVPEVAIDIAAAAAPAAVPPTAPRAPGPENAATAPMEVREFTEDHYRTMIRGGPSKLPWIVAGVSTAAAVVLAILLAVRGEKAGPPRPPTPEEIVAAIEAAGLGILDGAITREDQPDAEGTPDATGLRPPPEGRPDVAPEKDAGPAEGPEGGAAEPDAAEEEAAVDPGAEAEAEAEVRVTPDARAEAPDDAGPPGAAPGDAARPGDVRGPADAGPATRDAPRPDAPAALDAAPARDAARPRDAAPVRDAAPARDAAARPDRGGGGEDGGGRGAVIRELEF